MSNDFYGDNSNQSVSFLEFGSIHLGTQSKSTWAFLLHQEAYDLYMFSRYARDMFHFRDFINSSDPTPSDFWEVIQKVTHTDIDSRLYKFAGYMAVKPDTQLSVSVCEIGSSLFGMIDELVALDRICNQGHNIKMIETGKYIGCEISDFMNKGAKEFHPNANFEFYTDATTSKFLEHNAAYDLYFGTSISMQYSLRTSNDLLGICKRGKLNIFKSIFFSLSETREVDIGTGKKGFYPSINEFLNLLEKTGMNAKFGRLSLDYKDTDTLIVDLIVGKPENVDSFVTCFDEIRHVFSETVDVLRDTRNWCDVSQLRDYFNNDIWSRVKGKKVIVFGTGEASLKTLYKLNQSNLQVDYFVDNNEAKQGSNFLGHMVNDPDCLLHENKEDVMVIIASMYADEISDQLKHLGLKELDNFIRHGFLFYK